MLLLFYCTFAYIFFTWQRIVLLLLFSLFKTTVESFLYFMVFICKMSINQIWFLKFTYLRYAYSHEDYKNWKCIVLLLHSLWWINISWWYLHSTKLPESFLKLFYCLRMVLLILPTLEILQEVRWWYDLLYIKSYKKN